MAFKKTKSEKMGTLNIYLKFIEIFPEYNRYCQLKGLKLSNVQDFLLKIKEFPESIKHMKNCVICRTGSSGGEQIPLCWNCMMAISFSEYDSINNKIIEHVDYNYIDGTKGCFDSFGLFHRKACIHKK